MNKLCDALECTDHCQLRSCYCVRACEQRVARPVHMLLLYKRHFAALCHKLY